MLLICKCCPFSNRWTIKAYEWHLSYHLNHETHISVCIEIIKNINVNGRKGVLVVFLITFSFSTFHMERANEVHYGKWMWHLDYQPAAPSLPCFTEAWILCDTFISVNTLTWTMHSTYEAFLGWDNFSEYNEFSWLHRKSLFLKWDTSIVLKCYIPSHTVNVSHNLINSINSQRRGLNVF